MVILIPEDKSAIQVWSPYVYHCRVSETNVGLFFCEVKQQHLTVPIYTDQARIDMLPDDVLLEIFAISRVKPTGYNRIRRVECRWWIILVHVCRRWRQMIFGFPWHLDLRIPCHARRPTRTSLNIWPLFPLALIYRAGDASAYDLDAHENIIAALQHRERVSTITFDLLVGRSWESFISAMQEPFPALICLNLCLGPRAQQILSETFLGGSAPRLRSLILQGIPFPALPKLLLSTSRLVSLHLSDISVKGYISPEVMVTCLVALPNLEDLSIRFWYTESHPLPTIQRSTHWPTHGREILPSLSKFGYRGPAAYSEDFVGRINAPLLDSIRVTHYDSIIFQNHSHW